MPRLRLRPEQIAAWVEHNFPDHRTRRGGQEYVINSPFDGDTGHNMNVSLAGYCHDWRGDGWAEARGKRDCSFLNFVRLYRQCGWAEAVREVTGSSVLLWRRPAAPEPKPESQIALPVGAVPLLESPEPRMAQLLLNWLQSRGVDRQLAGECRLHHLGADVIWPYYEFEELVYWQSRSRLSKRFQFPAKSACGVAKSDFLYGFDEAEPAQHLILVEAIFDKLTLGRQCLATGGVGLSDRQLQKLKLLGPRDGLILAPDNDRAGLDSVVRDAERLRGQFKLYVAVPPRLALPGGKLTKDWNDLLKLMGREEVQQLFQRQIRRYDLRTLTGINKQLVDK